MDDKYSREVYKQLLIRVSELKKELSDYKACNKLLKSINNGKDNTIKRLLKEIN